MIKHISGVRHKCMTCPDWDYCSRCVQNARTDHPGHRFVPIYEALANPAARPAMHVGINCDGPLCARKLRSGWIIGSRFKCAVCHDTDFCASCEALPTNKHNRTHPLIKFQTPVRNVAVTTFGEKPNGEAMPAMGDKLPTTNLTTSSKSTETIPKAASANAATQVQTVAEVVPSPPVQVEHVDWTAFRGPQKGLQAVFVSDRLGDGSKLAPGALATQIWFVRNPGPIAWPRGCSIKYVGGDNMLNVDSDHGGSIVELVKATESNILGTPVVFGEVVLFSVTVKAPKRTGRAISYWRLKSWDGTSFGPKLSCDIDVVEETERIGSEESKAEAKDRVEDQVDDQVEDQVEAEIEADVKEKSMDVEQDVKQEASIETETTHESQMIFPILEKESPVASIHEAKGPADNTALAIEVAQADDELIKLLEDLETMGVDDFSSSDDGFLTDEEYEIVDADMEQAGDGELI